MSEIKNYITTDSGEFDPSRLGYPVPEDLDYDLWISQRNAENLAQQMAEEAQHVDRDP